MADVRSPGTAVQVRVPKEKLELEHVDELAHAHAPVAFEPKSIEHREREQLEEPLVERDPGDGLPLPTIDDHPEHGGGTSSDGEPAEGSEQFVLLEGGQAVLVSSPGVGLGAQYFDAHALRAEFARGQVDLVTDGTSSRLVMNGRLGLSELTRRALRLQVAALLEKAAAPIPSPADLPYGPFNLRFDLDARPLPRIEGMSVFDGETFASARRQMVAALQQGRRETFELMSQDLALVHDLYRDVAEVDPDFAFQELKLLFADFSTPAFRRTFPDLVGTSKELSAERWVKGIYRLQARHDADTLRAVTALEPAQLRFLLAGEDGQIFGPNDPDTRSDPGYPELQEAAVRFAMMRVTGAALWEAAERRTTHLERLLEADVPESGFSVPEPAAVAATVLGLAKHERNHGGRGFTDRVLRAVAYEEDPAGPFFTVAPFDVEVRPEHLEAFAEGFHPSLGMGLLDRLVSKDAAVSASVDPWIVALDLSLRHAEGPAGLSETLGAETLAETVFGRPARVLHQEMAAIDPAALADQLSRLSRRGGGLLVFEGREARPATAWGRPLLLGVPVRAEDLACCTATNDIEHRALTRGLSHLANTLERSGAPAAVVDELTELKSRANRPASDPSVVDDVARFIRTALSFEDARVDEVPAAALMDAPRPDSPSSGNGGSVRFVSLAFPEVDALSMIRPA